MDEGKMMDMNCDVCKAVGYRKKATGCIQIIGRKKDTILYLCKSCTKLFDDPLKCNSRESIDG
jgi:hypothetical protein